MPASERANFNANPLGGSVLIDEIHLSSGGFGKMHFQIARWRPVDSDVCRRLLLAAQFSRSMMS
jgi:hypothetical protein